MKTTLTDQFFDHINRIMTETGVLHLRMYQNGML